jgi:hypothetical protein
VTRARTTILLSAVLAVLGVAILLETALAGGGQVGYLMGSLLVLAGILRIVLVRRA